MTRDDQLASCRVGKTGTFCDKPDLADPHDQPIKRDEADDEDNRFVHEASLSTHFGGVILYLQAMPNDEKIQ